MLVLHYDFPSAASVVAGLRLQTLADEGLPVAFNGLDVLGLDAVIPAPLDLLEEWERHGREAADLGLPLQRPSRRPPTVAAHLVGRLADDSGCGHAWRLACWRAYWQRDADLADVEVLGHLAAEVGLPADAVAGVLGDRAAQVTARRQAIALRSRGIGGVPILEVDGTLMSALLPEADLRSLATL